MTIIKTLSDMINHPTMLDALENIEKASNAMDGNFIEIIIRLEGEINGRKVPFTMKLGVGVEDSENAS